MHELSIAQSLVEVALEHLPEDSGPVRVLRLKLGVLAGVEEDALRFGYDLVTQGTALEGSSLDIEDVPVVIYCAHCQQEVQVEHLARLRCPQCGQPSRDLRHGKELQIDYLELV